MSTRQILLVYYGAFSLLVNRFLFYFKYSDISTSSACFVIYLMSNCCEKKWRWWSRSVEF